MPNEFQARNGFISLKDSGVSGSLFVSGSISATGNIIAQQLIISSSVSYFTMSFSSGSTKFGDTLTDTHQFTGSVNITGSFDVTNTITAPNITSTTAFNANGTSATFNTSNVYVNSSNLVLGNDSTDVVGIAANTMYFPGNGNVGVGKTSPNAKFDVNGYTLVTGSLTVAPTAGNVELDVQSTGVKIGNSLADNHNITGSIRMPYTSSGMIILDDPIFNNVYTASDDYTQPQIRVKGSGGDIYRTGISILKNTEIHLVSNAKAIFAARTLSTIPRAVMASDVWLQWSDAETNTFGPDTTIRRVSAGVLQVTSSLIATSFTGSLQGTASFAVSASWAPSGAATSVTFNRVTASYTLVLADAGKTVEVSGSSNTTYNLTVPAASTTNFADGTFIDVILYGSGSIQFVTASGVTFRSANNWTKLGTRYGAATLINIAGDEWYLIGNLNA